MFDLHISLKWKEELHVFTIEKQITGFSCFLAKWHRHFLFFFIADKTILNSICFLGCFRCLQLYHLYIHVFHFATFFSPSSLSCWICLTEHEISFPRNRKHWIWGKYSHISNTTELLLLNISLSSALWLINNEIQQNVLDPLIHLLACLEIQAALHRISGYSRGHPRGQGFQTRPVAS